MPVTILKILLLPLALYLLFIILIYCLQEKMLFFPDARNFETCPSGQMFGATPVRTGVEGKEVRYWIRSVEKPEAVFIHFHGNAGSSCDRSYFFHELKELKVDLVLYEYPGYSGDAQAPDEQLLLENALAGFDNIMAEKKNLPVVLFGESLGSGVATWVASSRKISAMILQAPYTSLADVGAHHYPLLPVRLIMRNKFSAEKWAPKTACPVMILHGSMDNIIPIRFGKNQSRNFKSAVDFVEFENGGHNDLPDVDSNRYWSSIMKQIKGVYGTSR